MSAHPDEAPAIDPRAFRNALGTFATGVVVVTARDPSGRRYGMTVNSFSAVSLDPPLVLWSLSKTNQNCSVFTAADNFAINVLAMGQIDLSQRFARPSVDKFAGIPLTDGIGGAPLLGDTAAVFECRRHDVLEGGDHHILLGRVLRFSHRAVPTLVFCQGRYHRTEYLGPPLDPALETAIVWGWQG
jgi:flavin reductase (DIM6/NTAB) family NADH-FMN oxidoreductase RutF